MKTVLATTLAALLALPLGAWPHDDVSLDKAKAPNGGQLRAAGTYHFELVLARDSREPKENPVVVFVTDHADARIPTTGASGRLTLLGRDGAVRISLAPDGENRLKGSGHYAPDPELKAVVAVTFAGKPTEQARFTPFAAR